MRTWIFIDGKRTEPAESPLCFTLADIDCEHCHMGFMQSETSNPNWEKVVLPTWKSLVNYARKNKFDYLCLYLRECWPIKDSEIHTVETLIASRTRAIEENKLYQYWGK